MSNCKKGFYYQSKLNTQKKYANPLLAVPLVLSLQQLHQAPLQLLQQFTNIFQISISKELCPLGWNWLTIVVQCGYMCIGVYVLYFKIYKYKKIYFHHECLKLTCAIVPLIYFHLSWCVWIKMNGVYVYRCVAKWKIISQKKKKKEFIMNAC